MNFKKYPLITCPSPKMSRFKKKKKINKNYIDIRLMNYINHIYITHLTITLSHYLMYPSFFTLNFSIFFFRTTNHLLLVNNKRQSKKVFYIIIIFSYKIILK